MASAKGGPKKDVKEEEMVERVKKILFLKGRHSSELLNTAMKDLNLLSKPNCKNLTKKNEIVPFEDAHSLEFLGSKNECGLFVFGSHSKKRPNNLVIGRLYEEHLLDMYEFGVQHFQSLEDFPGNKKAYASKPLMVFLGDQWQHDSVYSKLQNLFLDLFRGFKADKFCLTGVDHIISCAVKDGIIFIRGYYVNYQATIGSNIPTLSLSPMGPYFDLEVRRTQTASEDLWKLACRKPKNLTAPKVKNVQKSVQGDKMGRIHMKKQNLDSLNVRRVNALRVGTKRSREGDDADTGRSNNNSSAGSRGSNKRPKK